MPYLDETGLETLVQEIKDYALQKTSVEYSKEFVFEPSSSNKKVKINIPQKPGQPSLTIIDIDLATNSSELGHGVLTIAASDSGTTCELYDDANNRLKDCVKYEKSDNTICVYITAGVSSASLSLHIKSLNTDDILFEQVDTSHSSQNMLSVTNILADDLNEIRKDINSISALVGGNTAFAANKVLVSNSSGKIVVSDKVTTTYLNYLDGVTSNIQTQLSNKSSTSHTHSLDGSKITGTLPVSKGGTGAQTAEKAQKKLGIHNQKIGFHTEVTAAGNPAITKVEIQSPDNRKIIGLQATLHSVSSDKNAETNDGYSIDRKITVPVTIIANYYTGMNKATINVYCPYYYAGEAAPVYGKINVTIFTE